VHTLLIDLGADAERVFNFETGNETRAELASKRRVLGESAEWAIVGECDKSGTKNGHQLTLPAKVLGLGIRTGLFSFAYEAGVEVCSPGQRGDEVVYPEDAGVLL
jgi:hypothetical protein